MMSEFNEEEITTLVWALCALKSEIRACHPSLYQFQYLAKGGYTVTASVTQEKVMALQGKLDEMRANV